MPEILAVIGVLVLLVVSVAGLAYRRYATRPLPDAEEYYQQGLVHLEEWSYLEAEEAFAQAIRRKPDYAAAYAGRGKASERRTFYRAAIQNYKRALELDPQLLPVYLDRAHAYTKLEQWDEAIADYTAVLTHASSDLVTKV